MINEVTLSMNTLYNNFKKTYVTFTTTINKRIEVLDIKIFATKRFVSRYI